MGAEARHAALPTGLFGSPCAQSDPHGSRRLQGSLAALLASCLAIGWSSQAQAVCSAVIPTVTCTGDVSAGASFGAPFSTLNVNSLTVNAGAVSLDRSGGAGSGGSSFPAQGDDGDAGDPGSGVTVNYTGAAFNINTSATGITAISNGGNGGSGGDGIGFTVPIPVPPFVVPVPGFGGDGGAGGNGGTVTVNSTGNITVTGDGHHGILAESYAGNGGNGGDSISILSVYGEGGDGGRGGTGGAVTVHSNGAISTGGNDAHGIFATSRGGVGGSGGDAGGLVATGGAGAGTGPGGNVIVTSDGSILTQGVSSHGIFAQSVGGFAGNGGSGGGLVGFGGSGESAGNGGTVDVTNSGTITTLNTAAYGILAQSIGGGGGAGGSGGGLVGLGGSGDAGGAGLAVTVTNTGTAMIHTFGAKSIGIVAQSIGGGGGDGGNSAGLAGIGGNDSVTSPGGAVTVTNSGSIITEGDRAQAILAQSIGGGGGNGGSSAGVIAIGGTGGGGGAGATVKVFQNGTLSTSGVDSSAVFAQSIGGGGGNGGNAFAGGLGGSLAIGGSGAGGGAGGIVIINETANVNTLTGTTISTGGDRSHGIQAQSIGGGGGNGGLAVSGAIGDGFSASFALGGSAAGGGAADKVTVNEKGTITTAGEQASGIYAQSVGGGGGTGGGSVAVTPAGGFSLGLAMGGGGGSGGSADTVTVNAVATITTTGSLSHGIFAESVGGGGGNGGFAVAMAAGGLASSIALGGGGGIGGVGGAVTVSVSGTIGTTGAGAVGIFTHSVGGGGGNGGFAVTGSGGLMSVAVSIGGSGGAGANGGAVTVDSSAGITTTGDLSYGILAQSVGGGGGNGGFAVSGAIGVSVEDIPGGAAAISVGGKGGGASSGGTVNVTNGGNIDTSGLGAHAIFAQSVGGGGGSGGFAFSGAFGFGGEKNVNVAVSIGGSGGSGGDGGTVHVDNQAAITTNGTQSHGIFAQSIGGGGGTGGFAVSGTLGLSPMAGNVGVTVGGGGGSGSTASTVTIVNSSAITTLGSDSIGIFGQSIGGSGGNGGMAITAQLTGQSQMTATIGVSVGGGGGNGNSAGEVDITNNAGGTIDTSGLGSHGIKAQSIGGGGGNGGMALVAQLGIAGGTEAQASKTLNVGVAVGGAGGDGGFGNTVHVINNGAINVMGASATGIFAQSVGGGGGDGGGAINALGMLTDSTNMDSRAVAVDVTVGGKGGNGNNGGAVTVDNSGSIVTHGASGYGVFAQSVGGGGGIGGRANLISVIVTDACTVPVLCTAPANVKNNIALSATVGGNGGGASGGGAVTVNNTGAIETFGDSSDGIYAQSVGGGGGAGGNGVLGSEGLLPVPVELAFSPANAVKVYQNIRVVVGGDTGSSGNGGVVMVDNDKNITTHGDNSNAIFAQSVGGGGGIAGNAVIGLLGTLGIGGKGGAAGNGGDVTVTQHGGATIETFGIAANGIFAQSVGGGGGVAGNVNRTLASDTDIPLTGLTIPKLNVGIGLAFGQGGGGGGDGGHVSVSVDGTVITHGDNAAGIFAQSVGGGGGMLGELGNDLPVLSLLSWNIGGNGDAGSAGTVDVTLTGAIRTAGNNATGIFAQSAGGTGTAGNVNVTLNSSILTGAILGPEDGTAQAPLRGLGSIGIFAQSVASDNANNGDVTINLNSSNGIVQGGRTMMLSPTVGYIGVGVWVEDGKNNTINNHGLVTTLGGVDAGYAILATGSDATHLGGNETVNNFGTITGSVDLGAGTNAFSNKTGATFNTGAVAFIGAGNLLSNDGTIAPGAIGRVFTTAVTGNFNQSSGGTYGLDLDFLPNTADRIDVSGTSVVLGTVAINRLNKGNAQTGDHQVTILASAGGVTDHTGLAISAPPSVVTTYGLLYPNPTDVVLSYNINFQPLGLPPPLQSIGNAINIIQSAGAFPAFAPIASELMDVPDIASLIRAYNTLGGGGTAATQFVAIAAGSQFVSTMFDQASFWFGGDGDDSNGIAFAEPSPAALQLAESPKSGSDAFAQLRLGRAPQPDRWRAWVAGFGAQNSVDADGSSGAPGLSQTTFGGSMGLDHQIDRNFLVGVALGVAGGNFSVPDRATSGSIEGGQVGVYGIGRFGRWYIANGLSYGRYANKTNRTIAGIGPTEIARGDFASDQFAGRLEVGDRIAFENFAFTPFTALEFSQLWQHGYSEVSTTAGGAPGILGLNYQPEAVTSLQTSLGAQFTSRIALPGGAVLSPFARAAWVHEFEPDRRVTPAFNVAPGVNFTSTGTRAASDLARLNVGANLRVAPLLSLYAKFTGDIAPNAHSYAGVGGYKVQW